MVVATKPKIDEGVWRYRWTRAEFEKAVKMGLFHAEARLELLDGEIIEMAAQDSLHATGVQLVQDALLSVLPKGYMVRVQLPFALDDGSEPEPDVAVVVGRPRDFRDRHPESAQLLVEVAYTTISYDRTRKLSAYARKRIPEYWILNLNDRHLEVYREPVGESYSTKRTLRAGESASPLPQPGISIAVDDLLP